MEVARSYALEGMVSDRRGIRPGYLIVEDGRAVEVGGGECPVRPDRRGVVLMDAVNGHTHCADYGLRVPAGMSLQELVAPPDGLKHRYLRTAPDSEIAASMRRFDRDSQASGAVTFTVQEAFFPLDVLTVIFARPMAFAAMVPSDLTVTALELLLHFTVA